MKQETLLLSLLILNSQVALSHAASPTTVAPPAIHLEVGQSHTFCVEARKFYNASGVCLEAGACYQFSVAPNDTWCDAKIRCGAKGWTVQAVRPLLRPLIRAAQPKRRHSQANWFELVGTIGRNECNHFRIGCQGLGWTYSPKKSGMFYAFANDMPRRYHNNSGSLMVTVTRVDVARAY